MQNKSKIKEVKRAARKMGCEFCMRTIVEDRLGKPRTGWGWWWQALPIEGNPPPRGTFSSRDTVYSSNGFSTKHEAAEDFLKWALVNL